jgi:hypothetical protein
VKNVLPDAVLIFLLPPSMRQLETQLRGRKTESEDKIQRRLQRAPEEIRKLSEYDYVVVNHEIAATQRQLEAIVEAERSKRTGSPTTAAVRMWPKNTCESGRIEPRASGRVQGALTVQGSSSSGPRGQGEEK